MGFISKKKKDTIFHKRNIEREVASQIVEIFEEKLEDLNVTLPEKIKDEDDKKLIIKGQIRKELISEVEDFIYINKRILLKNIA